MKGSYEITVENRRIQYKFTIKRNITILCGDSATGKTTLIDMIESFQNNGLDSGVILSTTDNIKCVVLSGMNWKRELKLYNNSIVFIDEGNKFINTKEFAEEIKKTTNYYVIATRNNLPNIPYSINEIYNIKNAPKKSKINKYQKFTSSFSNVYINERFSKPDIVIVEDSKSGYEFFKGVFKENNILCNTSNGKTNIYQKVLETNKENILIIADGSAFGSEIKKVLTLKYIKNIELYLPESFEWLILKSKLFNDTLTNKILTNPEEYINSKKYFSWEQFFTKYLVDISKDTYLKYSKNKLNLNYLNKKEKETILKEIPKEILKKEVD